MTLEQKANRDIHAAAVSDEQIKDALPLLNSTGIAQVRAFLDAQRASDAAAHAAEVEAVKNLMRDAHLRQIRDVWDSNDRLRAIAETAEVNRAANQGVIAAVRVAVNRYNAMIVRADDAMYEVTVALGGNE